MASNSTIDPDDDWVFYAYKPNEVLPIVGAAIFGASFLVQVFLAIRAKAVNYNWAFIVGCIGETVGYALRHESAKHPVGKHVGFKWYLGQNLALILAPAFLAASLYQVFGRTILYVGESFSPIRAKRVTITFVSLDVISFVVQGAGGSLYSSDNRSLYGTAKAILIVGFLIQIFSFGTFLVFSVVYHLRARRGAAPRGRWEHLLYGLWTVCFLILIRSVFRTAEFADGDNKTGAIQRREGLFYGFETLPVLIAVWVYAIIHPSRYIPPNKSLRMTETASQDSNPEKAEFA